MTHISTSEQTPTPVRPPIRIRRSRSVWLRLLMHSHWMSSAISLVGMVLFAITGITLNHATQIETKPVIVTRTAELPSQLQEELAEIELQGAALLPAGLADWLGEHFSLRAKGRQADWSADEIYLSMPAPGADAWLAIDRESGFIEFESTTRGWVAFFNDLHKGRHTGTAWSWFLDLFAIATLVFCITGLLLLYERAKHRRWTWPLVGLGLIAPWLLIIFLIH